MVLDAKKPLQRLEKIDKMEVKEHASKIEALTGGYFERPNQYAVYDGAHHKMFEGIESTGCCTRQLQTCFPDCAPWELDIYYLDSGIFTTSKEKAYKMSRPCTPCTCLCFNRPTTTIEDNSGNKVGAIRDPCACCPGNMTFTISDEDDNKVLWAESGCFQWGICCPLPFGPCKYVNFPIKDRSGNQVGELKKKMRGCFKMCCCAWLFGDVENYQIDCSGIEDPQHKVLLMALAIFTDFRYFHNTDTDGADDAVE